MEGIMWLILALQLLMHGNPWTNSSVTVTMIGVRQHAHIQHLYVHIQCASVNLPVDLTKNSLY